MYKPQTLLSKSNRILAAILFTDIKGYTALVQKDEEAAKALLQKYYQVVERNHEQYNGKVINIYGDGSVSTFNSALEAVSCARDMQLAFGKTPQIPVRMGIHIGDIVLESDNIFGHSVNVASRIESIAIPYSVLFSGNVQNELRSHPAFRSESLGKVNFKNLENEIEVFALQEDFLQIPDRDKLQGKLEEKKEKKNYKTLAIASLLSATLFLLAWIFFPQKSVANETEDLIPRIAVLPFKNTGSDSSQVIMARGFGQEILNKLSRLEDLHPITYTASETLIKENKSIEEVVKTLNITHLLVGDIQIHGGQMRIQVHLTDTKVKSQLWGNSLVRDYSMENIFALQNEVAFDIVEALKTKLLPASKLEMEKSPTHTLEAYALIIDARGEFAKRTPESLQNAISLLEEVKIIDPENALGFGMQAQVYATIAANYYQPWEELHQLVFEQAQKALSLDQNSAEAYMALGEYYHLYQWDFTKAEEMYQKAIQLKPTDANANQWLGELLLKTGKLEEARSFNDRSQQLDPTSRSNKYLASLITHGFGDIEESRMISQDLLRQYPDYPPPQNYLWYYYLAKGDYKNAKEGIAGKSKIRETFIFIEQKDFKSIEELYAPKALNPNIQFLIHVRKEEWAEAYALLDQLYQDKKYSWSEIQHVGQLQVFDQLRNNPKTKEVLARYGVEVFKTTRVKD